VPDSERKCHLLASAMALSASTHLKHMQQPCSCRKYSLTEFVKEPQLGACAWPGHATNRLCIHAILHTRIMPTRQVQAGSPSDCEALTQTLPDNAKQHHQTVGSSAPSMFNSATECGCRLPSQQQSLTEPDNSIGQLLAVGEVLPEHPQALHTRVLACLSVYRLLASPPAMAGGVRVADACTLPPSPHAPLDSHGLRSPP
jgi:hypothetical protein